MTGRVAVFEGDRVRWHRRVRACFRRAASWPRTRSQMKNTRKSEHAPGADTLKLRRVADVNKADSERGQRINCISERSTFERRPTPTAKLAAECEQRR